MWKYIKFGLRFFRTYYFHTTYPYFGELPYYKNVKMGTVAKVQCGGEFKYYDWYVRTGVGWVCFESGEALVTSSEKYKQRQAEIAKELQSVRDLTEEN